MTKREEQIKELLRKNNLLCAPTEKITSAAQKQAKNLSLYIENNVFSCTNAKTYEGHNPFMMSNFNDYKYLKEKIDFNLFHLT